MRRLTDLREILRYVPHFRDKLFVIAVDGAIVEDENFSNLLLDIALLRSLRIEVALVHGAGSQIERLARETGVTASNLDGTGMTDAETLQLALTAANRVTHEILEGLSANDLRGAYSNALVAHPKGIIQGLDHQLTGRVERVDTGLLQGLLDRDVIPIIPPLGCDGEGNTYRLNSDAVAVEVARSLGAVKLIYLTTFAGIASERGLLRQLTTEEAEYSLREHRARMNAAAISKLEYSIRATRHGVPRVHIIDGRVEEGLLAEVFSNEGIGTLVHANQYQAIRPALKKDVRALYELMQTAMDNDELIRRSRSEIQRHLTDFFVFEVDRNPVGCVAVHFYGEEQKAEIACLCVSPSHENQGIAAKLIQYAESHARARGAVQVFCLSTQAVNYFVQKSGFQLGSPDDLPAPRRERYERNARRSQVLVKPLGSKQAV